MKPSFDPNKELTILINWHTKLPLGKEKDSNIVVGEFKEIQPSPPKKARYLEDVDFSDLVIILCRIAKLIIQHN